MAKGFKQDPLCEWMPVCNVLGSLQVCCLRHAGAPSCKLVRQKPSRNTRFRVVWLRAAAVVTTGWSPDGKDQPWWLVQTMRSLQNARFAVASYYIYMVLWVFPKIGVPPNHPF